MGVRFQVYPRDQDTQIVVHFRLLDSAAVLQQEAIGILGVNLIYGAFFLHHEPDQLVESLRDDLGPTRVEVDLIDFSGIGFRAIDNRLMSLNLVQKGLSRAAMFGPDRKVRLPSEVFYKRPVLVERGSFRPLTNVNLDIVRAATEAFQARLPAEDKDRLVAVAELTMRNLTAGGSAPADPHDFLSRADVLATAGMTVLVSDFFEFYKLAGYLRGLTPKPLGLAMGAVTIPEVFDPGYYTALEGGILEAIGRLFRGDLTLFVYPYCDRTTGVLQTVDNLNLPTVAKPLLEYAMQAGRIVGLTNHDPACLPIDSRAVLKQIAGGDVAWEKVVPSPIVQLIKDRNLFGYRKKG
jgi:hypothetical protein